MHGIESLQGILIISELALLLQGLFVESISMDSCVSSKCKSPKGYCCESLNRYCCQYSCSSISSIVTDCDFESTFDFDFSFDNSNTVKASAIILPVGIIIAIVFGVIITIAIAVSVIVCCVCKSSIQTRRGRVINPPRPRQGVTTVTTFQPGYNVSKTI